MVNDNSMDKSGHTAAFAGLKEPNAETLVAMQEARDISAKRGNHLKTTTALFDAVEGERK